MMLNSKEVIAIYFQGSDAELLIQEIEDIVKKRGGWTKCNMYSKLRELRYQLDRAVNHASWVTK